MKNRVSAAALLQGFFMVLALLALAPAAQAAPPFVNAFTPQSGPVRTSAGRTRVTITGGGFFRLNAPNISNVFFNGVPAASFGVISDMQLVADLPDNATTGPITVLNRQGQSFTTDEQFVVTLAAPVIDSFTPTRGKATTQLESGTLVTIYGVNLREVRGVNFGGVSATEVSGGGTFSSGLSLVARVPQGATTGPIRVTNTMGTGASPANFVVLGPPNISSLSPTNGPVGTVVTISGSNFLGTGATRVAFNGSGDAAISSITDTRIVTAVPPDASTGPVTVITSEGSASSPVAFTVIKPPFIGSFTPAFGLPGSKVTITGRNFSSVTAVKFNGGNDGVNASFVIKSGNVIEATVPTSATTGPITVKNPAGKTRTNVDFVVARPPVISFFSPATGPVGTAVTITGSGFASGTPTSVTFNAIEASFVVNSSTSITATVPKGATTGRIKVTNGFGSCISPFAFTVTAGGSNDDTPPTVRGFTPDTGPIGTAVTITGVNLAGATAVYFGFVSAPFVVDSDTQLRTVVPAQATTGKIGVANAAGARTSSANFTVTDNGINLGVSSFSPVSGPVGTLVTINGSDFTSATTVRFGGVSASFTVVSDVQIKAVVPTGAATGPITITNAGGAVASPGVFTVTVDQRLPVIYSFDPTSGRPGILVNITGSNFSGVNAVKIGGLPALFSVDSNTSITAVVPDGARTGLISVANEFGAAVSATNFVVIGGPPVIDSFSPSGGPAGTVVTIDGANLGGATQVSLGPAPADFSVASDTQVRAIVPDTLQPGSYPITVTTPAGSAASAGVFTLTAAGGGTARPIVNSFSPPSGPVGTAVLIEGSNFNGTTSVTFGFVNAPFSVVSDTQIRATVPDFADTGVIKVTNAAGTGTSFSSFVVTTGGSGAPGITSFSPGCGAAGTVITINGSNFTGATQVNLGFVFMPFSVVSDTQIRATVPDFLQSGDYQIAVTTPAGSAASAGNFRVGDFCPF